MNTPTSRAGDLLHAIASRKAALHLMPVLMLIYFMAFIDRTNVGLAKSSLEADVGIGAAAYGLGAGIFFLSYALLEVPSNLIMHKVGPRRWIARIAVTWGALCAAMMFVQGETSFYVLRFLLGAAEAGLYPALMYIVTVWFAQSQRVTMVGVIYLAVCVALVLGGPIGGALMELAGAGDMHGWQWMFLVEGSVTVVLGFGILRWLPDKPADATWLTPDEAAILEERAAVQNAPAHTTLRGNARVAFARPFILALSAVYFANQVTSVAIQYNFPSIVENLDLDGPFMVGLVSGSVGLGALAGVLLVPAVQRRVRNEVRVIAVCSVAGTAVAIAYVLVVRSGPAGRTDRPRLGVPDRHPAPLLVAGHGPDVRTDGRSRARLHQHRRAARWIRRPVPLWLGRGVDGRQRGRIRRLPGLLRRRCAVAPAAPPHRRPRGPRVRGPCSRVAVP